MDIYRGAVILLLPIFLLVCSASQSMAAAQPLTEETTSDSGVAEPAPANFDSSVDETFAGDVSFLEESTAGREENLPTFEVWNLLISLALVLLIFWGIFRFIVRPLMRGAVRGRGVDDFRIVATLPLAPTKSVQIIKMVDRLLVVGIAEGGMRLLTEITDAAEVSEMLKALDEIHPARFHPFKKAFETILSRKDESGFEDRQKKFNTTLEDLKQKIKTMKSAPEEEEQ